MLLDPVIKDFLLTPEYFIGSEDGCGDAGPYNHFVLKCTATKSLSVIPELHIQWLFNGVPYYQGVHTNYSSNQAWSTLTTNPALSRDSGNYTCVATIEVQSSNTVTVSRSSSINIKGIVVLTKIIFISIIGEALPISVTDVMFYVDFTAVNVSWTVPYLAYTNETYYVEYYLLCNSSLVIYSDKIFSSHDINTVNSSYFVFIDDLSSGLAYKFRIVSENCFGSSFSADVTFETLHDGKLSFMMFFYNHAI